MKSNFLLAAILATAVFAAGCTETPIRGDTMYVSMDTPAAVFSDETFTAYLDIDNQGNRTYRNVGADFFNTGSFEKMSSCSFSSKTIRPNDIEILECQMKYNRFIERNTLESVNSRVVYDNNYNFGVLFPVMSESKYNEKKDTGSLESLPKKFSFSNDEISAEIELSENPVINRGGNDNYIYFTIKNTGNGFIENIPSGGIGITSVPSGVVYECDIPSLLIHDNGEFPKIVCRLDTALGESYQNVNIFLSVDYTYELRRSASITVKK